ncbi:MAG: serine--tRNA ligase [Bacilli bacterium]
MIDIKKIEQDPQHVEELLKRKLFDVDFTELLEKNKRRKELLIDVESNKAEQNKCSKMVPQYKKDGKNPEELFAKVKLLNEQNSKNAAELDSIEKFIFDFLKVLPNLPDEDLLPGEKENNKAIYTYKSQPAFDFPIKDHVELAESLGLIDYERAAKISGRGTWIYKGIGAQLEWALINFFIAEHIRDGYTFILPPHMLNVESGYTAGQFPKFDNDVFFLSNMEPRRFMLPTAETALVNLHRNEIIDIAELPKRYFAYTPCYRSEAGSYRTEERGTIRGYQFNKVEMVAYTKDDESDAMFDELVHKASHLVEELGLHFQISKLAAGDCSHSMARTYDIEVWIPSMKIYKECSSVSNARDYQARRGMMRYKDKEGKMHFVHTLNGSGLATSRIVPAILEQNQQADGSVIIPEVLRPFMGGLEKISPIKK